MKKHLSAFYGKEKYTATTRDWELYLSIPCGSLEIAIKLERRIKKMKSRKYIMNLKRYPELIQKLLLELMLLAPSFVNKKSSP